MKRHLHILNLVLHADRRTTLPTKRMIRNNSALYSKSQKALLLKEAGCTPLMSITQSSSRQRFGASGTRKMT